MTPFLLKTRAVSREILHKIKQINSGINIQKSHKTKF